MSGSVGTPVLEVCGLCKRYPSFALEEVSFRLEKGKIIGFIGRNGAGKSTTLKSVMGFLHADGGEIRFFGGAYEQDMNTILQRVGFVAGGVSYYPNKRLSQITAVTKSFYENWDEEAYADCIRRFSLDEKKTPAQLSAGMQVKYAITLALSHRAELLILDEPTSGLDPVSREDLLELLLTLARQGKTILFSTHITSDLDRCADGIVYIRSGRVEAESDLESFVNAYRVVVFDENSLTDAQKAHLIGVRMGKGESRALVRIEDAELFDPAALRDADLESVMVHLEKEGE